MCKQGTCTVVCARCNIRRVQWHDASARMGERAVCGLGPGHSTTHDPHAGTYQGDGVVRQLADATQVPDKRHVGSSR